MPLAAVDDDALKALLIEALGSVSDDPETVLGDTLQRVASEDVPRILEMWTRVSRYTAEWLALLATSQDQLAISIARGNVITAVVVMHQRAEQALRKRGVEAARRAAISFVSTAVRFIARAVLGIPS